MPKDSQVETEHIPNLVQGVSQQTPQQRRTTQCEAQFDCVNSPVEGALARPPVEFLKRLPNTDFTSAKFYDIQRNDSEHYLVVVQSKKIRVFNWEDLADECSVSASAAALNYLDAGNADPKRRFSIATREDFTFIANRQTRPEMNANLSPALQNAGIVFWKATGYDMKFVLDIIWRNKRYRYTYTTPDNSTKRNGRFINTNFLATAFARAIRGNGFPSGGGGGTDTIRELDAGGALETKVEMDENADTAISAVEGADAGTAGKGTVNLVKQGFKVNVVASCIKISRDDDEEFTLRTSDGSGDQFMFSAKGFIDSFNNLPRHCQNGFTVKVRGTNKAEQDDYWVKFQGPTNDRTGFWQEVVAPSTPIRPDATTMPHALINTNANTFSFERVAWGARVSGDGDETAKDPFFIGRRIQDIGNFSGRLAIMTEASIDWSKTRNPFTFFPTSAQTIIATDPVSITPDEGKSIVVLDRIIHHLDSMFVWGYKSQHRVSHGDEGFKQDTVECKKVTGYDYSKRCDPLSVGNSLYFTSEDGRYTTLRDMTILDGRPRGDLDVTAHVKRFVPWRVESMASLETLSTLILQTAATGEENRLFVYNYLFGPDSRTGQQNTRLQSAFNIWRLPEDTQVLYITSRNQLLRIVMQRGDDIILGQVDLSVNNVDFSEEGNREAYLTRLDMRITEADVTMVFNADTRQTAITVPYRILEHAGETYQKGEATPFLVVQRRTVGNQFRGKSWQVRRINAGGRIVTVDGNLTNQKFYLGFRITSEREETRLYIRKGEQELLMPEHLRIHEVQAELAGTGYTKLSVTPRDGVAGANREQVFAGRLLYDQKNKSAYNPIVDTKIRCAVNDLSERVVVKLINDSFLPSKWQALKYTYTATYAASKM